MKVMAQSQMKQSLDLNRTLDLQSTLSLINNNK